MDANIVTFISLYKCDNGEAGLFLYDFTYTGDFFDRGTRTVYSSSGGYGILIIRNKR